MDNKRFSALFFVQKTLEFVYNFYLLVASTSVISDNVTINEKLFGTLGMS